MNRATTSTEPVRVQMTVALTALIWPEPEAGGFSATIPALPGCQTQGETLEEVQANLKEAAEGWLAAVHEGAVYRDPSTEG